MVDESTEIEALEQTEEESDLPERMDNPLLEKFLQKWDRDLDQAKRCYGIKICFAGADAKKYREGLHRIGVQHISVSYFYLRKWLKKATVQEIADDLGRFDFVFLNSGGYTFEQASKKEREIEDIRIYADDYYKELLRIGHLFAGCSEVDSDVLGVEYSEEKKRQLVQENISIVPVIKGLPVEQYESYGWFDSFPYISISPEVINGTNANYLTSLYDLGKTKGIVFHGLGVSSSEVVLNSRFYSVESTTWKTGSRHGSTMLFQNGRIRHYDNSKKRIRIKFKRRFEENGLIWEDIAEGKAFEVDMMNALAWKQWSDYIRYSAHKCYWLKPDEWEEALELKSKSFNADGIIDRTTSRRLAQFRRVTKVEDAGYDDRAHEILHCNTCHMSGNCPRYKPNQPCGYDINVTLETKADLQKAMQVILEAEYGRVMTGVLFEKLQGGVLNSDVSSEMEKLFSLIKQSRSLFDATEEFSISAKGKSGVISNMLASVFSHKGSSASGSGNTLTQRASSKVLPETREQIEYDIDMDDIKESKEEVIVEEDIKEDKENE